MNYDDIPQDKKKEEDFDKRFDMDRLRDYSRQHEEGFNQWEIFDDDEDSADYWKRNIE